MSSNRVMISILEWSCYIVPQMELLYQCSNERSVFIILFLKWSYYINAQMFLLCNELLYCSSNRVTISVLEWSDNICPLIEL
jgi:hypothetical protein